MKSSTTLINQNLEIDCRLIETNLLDEQLSMESNEWKQNITNEQIFSTLNIQLICL